jgi:hypothetical protein
MSVIAASGAILLSLILLTVVINSLIHLAEFLRAWWRGAMLSWDEAYRRVLNGRGSIVMLPGFICTYW